MTCTKRFTRLWNRHTTSEKMAVAMNSSLFNHLHRSNHWRISAAVSQESKIINIMEGVGWYGLCLFTWDRRTTQLFIMQMCSFLPKWTSNLVMAPKPDECQDSQLVKTSPSSLNKDLPKKLLRSISRHSNKVQGKSKVSKSSLKH